MLVAWAHKPKVLQVPPAPSDADTTWPKVLQVPWRTHYTYFLNGHPLERQLMSPRGVISLIAQSEVLTVWGAGGLC